MKKLERLVILSLTFVMVASLLTPVWAQGGVTINLEELDVDENTFPEMSAVISVVNASKVPVEELTQSDFEVYEGGQPLPIKEFGMVEDKGQTLAVALVLDLSLSSPVEEAKAAANWLLDSLGPDDRVALIGFNEPSDLGRFDPDKEVEFTTNKELIRNVINGFDESSLVGVSAVYDAIYKGVYITAQEKAERRAVVVVTDGFEYQGTVERDAPGTLARSERVPVFTIGVYSSDPQYGSDPAYLQGLAQDTGGRYQEATDPSLLTDLFQDVVGQLWLKYEISFWNPDLPRDGKDHVLTFQVSTPDGNDMINKTARYPEPPPRPQIARLQQDINGKLEELRSELKEKVLLVPEINARNPIVRVEYFLDGQLAHVVMVDVQESVGKHEPWEWKLDTCDASTGSHTLGIIAYDDDQAASDQFSESIEIIRSGICLPGVGSVDSSIAIGVGLALLFLLLLVVLIVISRRRRPQHVSEGMPTMGPSTVPAMPSFPPMGPPASYDQAPPPPPPSSPPNYVPTQAAQPSPGVGAGAGVGGRPQQKTEVLRREPSAMAWLVAQEGPVAGREFRLGEVTTIGRTGDNDIVLDDSAVSRQHAKVKLEGQVFFLYDLGATNTTVANGQEIARHQLRDGDRVEVGHTVFVFKAIEPNQS